MHRASKRSRRKIVAARSLLSLYCCAPSNVTVAESFHINIESVELSTRLEQVESKLESGKVCSKVTSAASPSQTFLQGRMEGHTSAFFVFDKIQTLFRQWHCHCPHSRLQRFESDRRMQCRHVWINHSLLYFPPYKHTSAGLLHWQHQSLDHCHLLLKLRTLKTPQGGCTALDQPVTGVVSVSLASSSSHDIFPVRKIVWFTDDDVSLVIVKLTHLLRRPPVWYQWVFDIKNVWITNLLLQKQR